MPLSPKVLSPEALSANGEVTERLLAFDFSFALERQRPGWFSVDGLDDVTQVGSEGSGGTFVLLSPGPVLYVSSEGRAGIIAATFEEFIQLIVACPYWLDILKFSGGGATSTRCGAPRPRLRRHSTTRTTSTTPAT
jgi:hypothetical protein